MKTYKSILTFSLVLGSLGSSGCNLHTQQEFEKICLFPENDATPRTCQFAKSCSPTGLCPYFFEHHAAM